MKGLGIIAALLVVIVVAILVGDSLSRRDAPAPAPAASTPAAEPTGSPECLAARSFAEANGREWNTTGNARC